MRKLQATPTDRPTKLPDPVPSYVAGFKQWKSLGRTVDERQSGYRILAPVTARYASGQPDAGGSWRRLRRGERLGLGETVRLKLVGLRPAYVWDVSQTSGEPIPKRPRPRVLNGAAPEGLLESLAAQISAAGFELRRVPEAQPIGGANGLTDHAHRVVSVRTDMDPAARTKTLAHELAHVLLHDPANLTISNGNSDGRLHRGIAEVEAESVALMVGAAHGMDTTTYTVPYVSTWAHSVPDKTPTEVVQSTAERVRSTAIRILDALDTLQAGGGDPPGLHRQPPRTGQISSRAAAVATPDVVHL
ncbi:ImmA/IrrE family metallo-endopeptidase [Nocardioides sambongensis]|uniref:ImmA/IrrE family metallo-endopeptidase n=1 Tax=Nocardioides sambongensis TaxID=2589074 RepID=UPI001126A611|nr:ImmA/IrrE family metallo-endopeptidase [Nocardioides sambongensis]